MIISTFPFLTSHLATGESYDVYMSQFRFTKDMRKMPDRHPKSKVKNKLTTPWQWCALYINIVVTELLGRRTEIDIICLHSSSLKSWPIRYDTICFRCKIFSRLICNLPNCVRFLIMIFYIHLFAWPIMYMKYFPIRRTWSRSFWSVCDSLNFSIESKYWSLIIIG